jgi:hypothetical protein
MKKNAIHNPNPISSYFLRMDWEDYGRKGYKESLKEVSRRWHRAQSKVICRKALHEEMCTTQ